MVLRDAPATREPAPRTDVDALIASMTLKEKCSLTVGADNWHTAAIARLGIPAVKMTDGLILSPLSPETKQRARKATGRKP